MASLQRSHNGNHCRPEVYPALETEASISVVQLPPGSLRLDDHVDTPLVITRNCASVARLTVLAPWTCQAGGLVSEMNWSGVASKKTCPAVFVLFCHKFRRRPVTATKRQRCLSGYFA